MKKTRRKHTGLIAAGLCAILVIAGIPVSGAGYTPPETEEGAEVPGAAGYEDEVFFSEGAASENETEVSASGYQDTEIISDSLNVSGETQQELQASSGEELPEQDDAEPDQADPAQDEEASGAENTQVQPDAADPEAALEADPEAAGQAGTEEAGEPSGEEKADALEVAEDICTVIEAAGSFDNADLEGMDRLQTVIDEVNEGYETLTAEEQETLQGSMESFENACAAAEVYQDVLEGNEIAPAEKENSYRYINGEPIADALETVEEETLEIEALEAGDGQAVSAKKTIPSANIAMVKTAGTSELVSLAEAKAVAAASGGDVHFGIDVSHHNGTIDWAKAKNAGIEFAVIRCGHGENLTSRDDRQWERNVSEVERLGIPYGVYLYSYALDIEGARSEAEHTLRLLKGHHPQLPVYYDMEDSTQRSLSKSTLNDMSLLYCSTLREAGYSAGFYSYRSWITSYMSEFIKHKEYYIWVAALTGTGSPNYDGDYHMWQYSHTGRLEGVTGVNDGRSVNVDLNYLYGSLNTSLRTGPVKVDGKTYVIDGNTVMLKETGEKISGICAVSVLDKSSSYYSTSAVYYCSGGEISGTFTGLMKDPGSGKYYYFTDGKLDKAFKGLVHLDRWYYVRNGSVDFSHYGIEKSPKNGKLYAVQKGVIENDFVGIARYAADGKWYFTNKSVVDRTFTGVAKHITNGNWYFVRKGVYDPSFTGIAKSAVNDNWYFVKKGKVIFTYTGIAKSILNGNWYFAKNGKVNFKFTGIAKSIKDGNWYFVRKGKYDNSFTGVAKSVANSSWYYVRRGKLNRNYTGLAKSAANGKWYYVYKGKVNFRYAGKVKYKGRRYTVKNGRVVGAQPAA